MEKIREFGILKWIIFPSMSLTLAGVIGWFNIVVFGWEDGAFYIVAVAIIAAFSIAINKYVGSPSSRLSVAAFCFELALIIVLGANAIYSLSVQREMAVARMGEKGNVEALQEIKQLKSRTAQRDATRMVAKKEQKNSQEVFATHERILLYLMAGEMLAYIVAAFSLYALSHLVVPKRNIHEESLREIEENYRRDGRSRAPEDGDLPVEPISIPRPPTMRRPVIRPSFVEAKKADSKPREHLELDTEFRAEKKDTEKTHVSFDPEAVARLRDVLKTIAFYTPGRSFKVDVKPTHLWIRQMLAREGTQETMHSVSLKLDILADVMTMPEDAFRARLEKFLRQNGFSI